MTVSATGVTGSIVEIFPTIFMAALLSPLAYSGSRKAHTDDLWLRVVGSGGSAPLPALTPYAQIAATIENSPCPLCQRA